LNIKNWILSVFFTCISFSFFSQVSENKIQALAPLETEKSCIQKNDNVIHVFYGANIFGSLVEKLASKNTLHLTDKSENIKFKSYSPVGIAYEHLVNKYIGLGGEFGLTNYSLTYDDTFEESNGLKINYSVKAKITVYRVFFRANFHFTESEKVDAYAFLSGGYRGLHAGFTTNYSIPLVSYDGPALIPFGIKPGIGFRYFFTSFFGINAELAVGTPIICGGLSFKFK
jgi:hypothetical protein